MFLAGKFGDLKRKLFHKKEEKLEEKIYYSVAPTSEMNPSEMEKFKETHSGFCKKN